MKPMWPHQEEGVDGVVSAHAGGHRRICLTSPTGGGKTRMIAYLAEHWLARGKRVVLYTNRKMLVEQVISDFAEAGLDHGVRAAGHQDQRDKPLQVSSIQTENARVLKRTTGAWELHDAALVLVDECHNQTGKMARTIIDRHVEAGATVVGVTATPIDLAGIYTHLVVAGVTSGLRKCGALVPAVHYGPDEPDLRHVGRVRTGEDLTEKQNVKAIMTPSIFGRVWEWYQKLNPDRRPAILFAPGVAESLWFAEQFHEQGVTACSIDGDNVWVDGELMASDRKARQEVLDGSRRGSIQVICNRFVLREGVNCPWLYHGIFATVFGSLQSYLQSGGRLLRNHDSLDSVVVQDHGGNWWRHGSLNADRQWNLGYSNGMITGMREDRFREKRDREPLRCPQCGMVLAVLTCPCGYQVDPRKKSRPVIQADGSMKEHRGDIYRGRPVSMRPDTFDKWRKMYFRARAGKMTFRQAYSLFNIEHGYFPPKTLPLMPALEYHWYSTAADVPADALNPPKR